MQEIELNEMTYRSRYDLRDQLSTRFILEKNQTNIP